MLNTIVKYRHLEIILHVLAWSLMLFLPYLVSERDNQYKIGPLPGGYFTLAGVIHIFIFYTNALFLFPRLLNKRYGLLYLISAILLIALSVWLKSAILNNWFSDVSADARAHILFPSVIVFIVSVFYSIVVDKIRTERLQKQNEALQLMMELKFLRSQISPHFLFNVLTSMIALARKKSDYLETSLHMLSNLMRYMLYNAGRKIPVEQELDYLRSYVDLQKLRFGDALKIKFVAVLPKDSAIDGIEPMLLVPFIENAFKHGTGYVDDAFIEIGFHIEDGVLNFKVKNRFDYQKENSHDESSGIGLSNVRSRLELLYPGRHQLVIGEENTIFHIQLTLELS